MKTDSVKTAVLGAGRSGRAAAALLKLHGADVTVFDAADSGPEWTLDVPLVRPASAQDGILFKAELVVLSPGIPTDRELVRAFTSGGGELIGEVELSSRLFGGSIIAVTGTNGKTTTTALIESILLAEGKNAAACGNYGIPLSELMAEGKTPDIAVIEVSSFQLETIRRFKPDTSVWLNFAPDHMDRYSTVEEYYQAKLHIFDNQDESDLAIIRYGETIPRLRAGIKTFSSTNTEADLYYRNGAIIEHGYPVLSLDGTPMAHPHNAENVMAAWLAVRNLGVSTQTIARALQTFVPPGHRCELVRELGGVAWYNDSKATNVHAMHTAVRSQTKPVILIAGGKDKGLDYSPVRETLAKKVKYGLFFGEIASDLAETFHGLFPLKQCGGLEDCVREASHLSQPGDIVLFSPGTSSFDMYAGYEQRGEAYRDAVRSLSPQTP